MRSQAPGPGPYTILIEPGGKIVQRVSGEADMAQLQAKVIETLAIQPNAQTAVASRSFAGVNARPAKNVVTRTVTATTYGRCGIIRLRRWNSSVVRS